MGHKLLSSSAARFDENFLQSLRCKAPGDVGMIGSMFEVTVKPKK